MSVILLKLVDAINNSSACTLDLMNNANEAHDVPKPAQSLGTLVPDKNHWAGHSMMVVGYQEHS